MAFPWAFNPEMMIQKSENILISVSGFNQINTGKFPPSGGSTLPHYFACPVPGNFEIEIWNLLELPELLKLNYWNLLELPEKSQDQDWWTQIQGTSSPWIHCTHHPLKTLLESHLWIEIPLFLPLWVGFPPPEVLLGWNRQRSHSRANHWFFSGMIPWQGESTATARSSECCGKQQNRHPSSTGAARAQPHSLSHSQENLVLLAALTREFWQGCPEQVSVIFLCQVLTGQAALGFYFLPPAGYCREKKKKHKYFIYLK